MENKKEILENQSAEIVAEPAMETAAEPTQIELLTAQIAGLNDKYLRAVAELENTRRRAALDAESSARNRAMSIATNFLPVVDAIDAALSHTPEDEGIKLLATAMKSVMTKIGIKKIESIGQKLNPQFHNAIQVVDTSQSPVPNPQSPNTIVSELQTGYMFGDMTLRPAMVVVCK